MVSPTHAASSRAGIMAAIAGQEPSAAPSHAGPSSSRSAASQNPPRAASRYSQIASTIDAMRSLATDSPSRSPPRYPVNVGPNIGPHRVAEPLVNDAMNDKNSPFLTRLDAVSADIEVLLDKLLAAAPLDGELSRPARLI